MCGIRFKHNMYKIHTKRGVYFYSHVNLSSWYNLSLKFIYFLIPLPNSTILEFIYLCPFFFFFHLFQRNLINIEVCLYLSSIFVHMHLRFSSHFFFWFFKFKIQSIFLLLYNISLSDVTDFYFNKFLLTVLWEPIWNIFLIMYYSL